MTPSRPLLTRTALTTATLTTALTTALVLAGCSAGLDAVLSAPAAPAAAPVLPPTVEALQAQVPTAPRTAVPDRPLTTDVTPYGDRVVGVGHPLVVRLSEDVADRAAVERALTVTTSRPVGEAGWAWQGDRELHYRPRTFWPAHTTVTLEVRLAGVSAGQGVSGVEDREVRFRTGAARVVTIDDAAHRATVTVDGRLVRTMPVSLGKPGYETRSGTKVVMDRHETYRMRSSTLGVTSGPEAYDLVVPYAMRLTTSGEFLHAAPWATARLGRANGSHGCVNLSVVDARWLYERAQVGDPVVTVGSGPPAESGNGLGGGWNVPWSTWLGLSALPAA